MDEQELLRTVPIFSELTDDDIASLARLALAQALPEGHRRLLRERGRRLLLHDPRGPDQGHDPGRRRPRGHPLDAGRRATSSARWRCSTTSRARRPPSPSRTRELLSLHRTDFQTVLTDNRQHHLAPHQVLTGRLRQANHQISTLALLDVYGRVARVIVDMAREEGRRLKDGRIAFRRATHQEIANRIGTTRETVTRMLKDLERQGLIHVEGKEIVVQPDFEKVFD